MAESQPESQTSQYGCPYCDTSETSEHALRVHITNSTEGRHEGKNGHQLPLHFTNTSTASGVTDGTVETDLLRDPQSVEWGDRSELTLTDQQADAFDVITKHPTKTATEWQQLMTSGSNSYFSSSIKATGKLDEWHDAGALYSPAEFYDISASRRRVLVEKWREADTPVTRSLSEIATSCGTSMQTARKIEDENAELWRQAVEGTLHEPPEPEPEEDINAPNPGLSDAPAGIDAREQHFSERPAVQNDTLEAVIEEDEETTVTNGEVAEEDDYEVEPEHTATIEAMLAAARREDELHATESTSARVATLETVVDVLRGDVQ